MWYHNNNHLHSTMQKEQVHSPRPIMTQTRDVKELLAPLVSAELGMW